MEFARGRQSDAATQRSGHLSAGSAWRDPILITRQDAGAEGVDVSSITFEPGAYIRWHSHANGQILIINSGKGVIVTRGGDICSLLPADVVYAEPNEEHWHGAGPETSLTQINISMGHTNWLEEVTPEEYRRAANDSAVS